MDEQNSSQPTNTSANASQEQTSDDISQTSSTQGNATTAANSGTANGSDDSVVIQQELEKLQSELAQNKSQLEQMANIAKQALADLQNFRRRAQEDQKNYTQYANADLILNLLPALENLGRALNHEPKDEAWSQGITQTAKQFWQILEKLNVKAIESLGTTFDPNIHEALMTGPGEKDKVLEEFEKGYLLADKVLKRARVKVGNGETA